MRIKVRVAPDEGFKYIEVIPLVNIIFLLLIFIMLFFVSYSQPGIRVNLPRALTTDKIRATSIEILISQDGTIYFNDRAITQDKISALLKEAARNNQSVLVKADKHAPLGKLIEVWDKARNSGISQINTLTD